MEKNKGIVDLFVERYMNRRGVRKAQTEEKDMTLKPEEPVEDEIEKLTEEEAMKEIEKSGVDEKEEIATDIEEEIICFISDLCDYYDMEVEDLVDALKEVFEDEEARKELIEKVKSAPKGEGFKGEEEVEEEPEEPEPEESKEIPVE